MGIAARYLPAGDRALVVEFGDSIDEGVNGRVNALYRALVSADLPGIVELVPTYRSLLVHYDPLIIGYSALRRRLRRFERLARGSPPPASRRVRIPVVYGGEYGPDIEDVARRNGIDVEELIAIHSSADYLVYMLGFTPGFPYLGGMSERIASPRLESPRTRIPAGSVGIAGSQTGVYPIDSPGGWRLIGRTPLRLFDPRRDPPTLLAAGDHVEFSPINAAEYEKAEGLS